MYRRGALLVNRKSRSDFLWQGNDVCSHGRCLLRIMCDQYHGVSCAAAASILHDQIFSGFIQALKGLVQKQYVIIRERRPKNGSAAALYCMKPKNDQQPM